jgi:hypothetical protein
VPFVDLSVGNELDVIEQHAAMLEQHGAYFDELFNPVGFGHGVVTVAGVVFRLFSHGPYS